MLIVLLLGATMAWACELPKDLLYKPLGLIALTGLDTTYNAVHKAIWDSFCNNRRSDRLPLRFNVFSTDHEYPKCKIKVRVPQLDVLPVVLC